jgi:single-strand DNA-binding protein
MNHLNTVMIEGRATQAPELRGQNSTIAVLTVASDRFYRQNDQWQQETAFVPVTAFGNVATRAQNAVEKGQLVRITGRLQLDQWQDQDGQNRERLKVVATSIETGPKAQNESESQGE